LEKRLNSSILEQAPTRVGFGQVLRQLREAAGLSYNALGERARIDPKYLYNLEAGKRYNPSRNAVIRIGIGLCLDVDSLDEILTSAGHVSILDRAK
jgi:transcriptional regulator with XRE-family HTH domain